MVKNLDDISLELIEDKVLLRLNMQISVTRYLQKGVSRFTKIIKDNKKMIKEGKKAETVSNSEKKNKKKALHKEKRDAQALLLAAACPSVSASAVSVPESASLSASAFASVVSMPGLSTLLSPALPSMSVVFVLVPGSSALLSSALLSVSGVSVSVLRSSALWSTSDVSVPLPEVVRSSVYVWYICAYV